MKTIIHYNAILTHLNRLLRDSSTRITLNELIILESLRMLGGRKRNLAYFTGKDSSYILRTLNTLHRRGFIIKSRSSCCLTPEGESILRESKVIADHALKMFGEDI